MLDKITAYYRACYQADLRTVNLTNFFGNKVLHQHLLDSAELLEGTLRAAPLSTEWAEKVTQHLAIYSKEQTLYCCAFFVRGAARFLGKKQDVFAPLFLYKAELKWENEVAFISIDTENVILNPSIVSLLKNAETDSQSNIYDRLSAELPKGIIGFTAMAMIEEQLQRFFPDLNLDDLKGYPDVYDEAAVKAIRSATAEEGKFKLIPAIGVGVMKKSTASRGILTELESMVQNNDFSQPIHSIFGLQNEIKPLKIDGDFMIPVTLSESQQAVFRSIFKNDLTLVVGPPGTGKSFTIAALAVEMLTRGMSVLIASKNDQAVNVIANKIERDFGLSQVVVNAANKNYKKALQARLQNLLSGMTTESNPYKIKTLQEKLSSLLNDLNDLENTAELRAKIEREEGRNLHNDQRGLLQLSKRTRRFAHFLKMENAPIFEKYFPIKTIQKRLANRPALWELMFDIEQLVVLRQKLTRQLVKQSFAHYLSKGLRNYRIEILNLLKALRARTGNKKADIFGDIDFKKVMDTLPIWTVNTADVHTVLPLQKEVFDLVIIDEATQCDTASILPLLQRGKRVVIVGDPKQLRHLSFLSRQQQELLYTQHDLQDVDNELLNYREKSVLDLVFDTISSQEQVQFLNEHYRSMPDIIGFSNARFYDNHLTVMTTTPATQSHQHIFLHPTDGKRYKTGYNKIEAEAILDEVERMMTEEKLIHDSLCQSIGILSPFREQVNYLQKQISQRFSIQELERHRILVGTPFNFQGEERDVMLLSFVLDNDAHSAAFRYLNRADVFNVSITRARVLQRVYTSFDSAQFSFQNLVFDYVNSLRQNAPTTALTPDAPPDDFMLEVADTILDFDVRQLYRAYPIAGVEIDIVVVNKTGQTCCIDLVGYPGEYEDVLPLERWRMLERVGMRVFFLSYSRWYFERERCVGALREFVG